MIKRCIRDCVALVLRQPGQKAPPFFFPSSHHEFKADSMWFFHCPASNYQRMAKKRHDDIADDFQMLPERTNALAIAIKIVWIIFSFRNSWIKKRMRLRGGGGEADQRVSGDFGRKTAALIVFHRRRVGEREKR